MDSSLSSVQSQSVDEIICKAAKDASYNVLNKYRKLQCRSYLMMRYIEMRAKPRQPLPNANI